VRINENPRLTFGDFSPRPACRIFRNARPSRQFGTVSAFDIVIAIISCSPRSGAKRSSSGFSRTIENISRCVRYHVQAGPDRLLQSASAALDNRPSSERWSRAKTGARSVVGRGSLIPPVPRPPVSPSCRNLLPEKLPSSMNRQRTSLGTGL
jgi:hypothetical protein